MFLGFGVGILVTFLYVLFYFCSYKVDFDFETGSGYECGFESMSSTRVMFSYRFFLISILFLIFDVEVVLMLPVPFNMVGGYFFFFILILVGGLVHEYNCGSLSWLIVSKA